MDQLPRGNEGFTNNNLFGDSQQYNAYDNLFQNGTDQNSYDASWGINASNYPVQSRAAQPASAPAWVQNANHLSAHPVHANINGQTSPYARSLSHSPVAYGQNTFNGYAAQNFPYRQSQYDPALVPQHPFNTAFHPSTTNYQLPNAGTIAPHALQHENRSPHFAHSPPEAPSYQATNPGQQRTIKPSVQHVVNQSGLLSAIPKGQNGARFTIINFDELSKATNSERMGSFINIGKEAQNWNVNQAAPPPYAPRKSRNELRRLAANDPKLLARLGKTGANKQRALGSAPKALSTPGQIASPAVDKIKYEDDSPSEEESSSETDDDSSYMSEDDASISPLPAQRPTSPRDATEYDTIKALWRGKRRTLAADSVRQGLKDFWEIVKTIRDRWKLDVNAVADAESKKRTNELPLLESRVKDQRDMLETAFKAALKHGHRSILDLMSENPSLLFLCYQFLLDRAKAEDFSSSLPRVMLETISLFTTITDEKLEQTHLVKVLQRFVKKGDAKTQFYAKRITSNASAAKAKSTNQVDTKVTKTGAHAASPRTRKAEPAPVAGVKRPSDAASDEGAAKKLATGSSKLNGVPTAMRQGSVVKKIASASASSKPVNAASTTVNKPKQVVAKPSGLFSSLQSAAKKPGTAIANKMSKPSTATSTTRSLGRASSVPSTTGNATAPQSTFSFAETMANLSKPKEDKPVAKPEKQTTPETAEEQVKRLRKEARRSLSVRFKPDEDLVQVREFYHDPEEELGHDANQVRDLGDVGGEGRMLKQQHQMMDIDDEDEVSNEQDTLIDFEQPSQIDFSEIDTEERKRNYAKYGGGEAEPTSDERPVRENYEANTLMVFYTNSKDVPPNPREPSDPYNGEKVDSLKRFGLPEEKWATRARVRNVGNQQQSMTSQQPTTQATPASTFDFSKISGFMGNSQGPQQNGFQQHGFQQQSQPAAPNNDAITNILASLKQAQTNQGTPPVPMMGGFGSTFAPPPQPAANPFANMPQPPKNLPTEQPDLAAILAQIQQTQTAQPQAPQPGGFMQSYQPQMQQQGIYENPDRKQFREGGSEYAAKTKRGNATNFRTKICKYWQEGRCQKGDGCTYKHTEE